MSKLSYDNAPPPPQRGKLAGRGLGTALDGLGCPRCACEGFFLNSNAVRQASGDWQRTEQQSMYRLELSGRVVGYTRLETGDPPMGVATGIIHFTSVESPFELLRSHCEQAGVPINALDDDFQFIDTQVIPELKVYRSDGLEIVSEVGACVTGMAGEGYQVSVLGIPYPFCGEEFARLCRPYDEQFNVS